MTTLESVEQEIFGQRMAFDRSGDRPSCSIDKRDVLFFPRKLLRVRKIRSGFWNPEAWFIAKRLDDVSTRLERATELTGMALSSGLRSAIILGNDGKYVKLKGVASKVHEEQGGNNGICTLADAVYEQLYARLLTYYGDEFVRLKPKFIEAHIRPGMPKDFQQFLTDFSRPQSLLHTNQPVSLEDYGSQLMMYARKQDNDTCCVSAFEIDFDTRLDEVVYHLTKTELRGDKKTLRDQILLSLAFIAGKTRAYLTNSGYAWGSDLVNTNNHIGNFVVYPNRYDTVNVGLADLAGLKHVHDFESLGMFEEHVQKEIDSFQNDFNDTITYSFPTGLKYRHFPEDLRADCHHAFKTGYLYNLMRCNQTPLIPWRVREPEKVVVPSKLFMSEQQFRRYCAQIMN